MLAAVFRFKLPEISSDPVLKDLLRSFHLEKPRSNSSQPSWDLDAVLRHLNSSTFEPLESAPLKALTKKTLFLIALATAKRVGELQALSSIITSVGKDVSLSYLPSFVAKTESVSNPLPRSFLLKSLEDFEGAGVDEQLLCPVRALRIYMDRTKDIPSRPRSLFVSPRVTRRPISKNAVSFFLRELISEAGALTGFGDDSRRAHSIRGVATSFNFWKNCSVASVLEAATWRSSSVFARCYLKDIQHMLGGCRSLGPFVAAGSIVN